jgi:hypothetical protein
VDREEVIGVAPARKLHAAGLVGRRVYHRKLPLKRARALVVLVVAVALGHHGRVHAVTEIGKKKGQKRDGMNEMSNSRDGDGYDDVVELEVSLFQLVLYVDIAAALAVVGRPAVDYKDELKRYH